MSKAYDFTRPYDFISWHGDSLGTYYADNIEHAKALYIADGYDLDDVQKIAEVQQ